MRDFSTIEPKTVDTPQYADDIVYDLVDALQFPPYEFTQEYVRKLVRVASWLGQPQADDGEDIFSQTGAQATWPHPAFPESDFHVDIFVGPDLLAQEKARNFCNKVRNVILEVIDRVADFVFRAREMGVDIPENPFSKAASFNSGRIGFTPVLISKGEIVDIKLGVGTYMKLMSTWENDTSTGTKSSQIVSAEFSLDGLGDSSDSGNDLARLGSRVDVVREQKRRESYSSFSFSKRVPKVVFTATYAPDGSRKGVLVGIKRMADASGYLIDRNELFSGKSVQYTLTNETAIQDWERFHEYAEKWILSFYQGIDPKSLFFFFDHEVPSDEYFSYDVQAFQLQNDSLLSIFSIDCNPILLSESQKIMIRNQMELLDPGSGPDTISPWPVISHFVLGDAKYDWILAGINSRASVDRGDDLEVTRGYSYIRAQLDFLFKQADLGKLLMPVNRDVSPVVSRSQSLISKFGFFQFIRTILRETGVLFSLEGIDLYNDPIFREMRTVDAVENGIVGVLDDSIDADTGTLDIGSFSSNIGRYLSGEFVSAFDSFDFIRAGAVSSEIALSETNVSASSDIPYLNSVENSRRDIDLMTFDGISSMMRLVRLYSDIGPNRSPLFVATATAIPTDTVIGVVAEPITKSSVQPVDPNSFQETTDGYLGGSGTGGGGASTESSDTKLAKEAAKEEDPKGGR